MRSIYCNPTCKTINIISVEVFVGAQNMLTASTMVNNKTQKVALMDWPGNMVFLNTVNMFTRLMVIIDNDIYLIF